MKIIQVIGHSNTGKTTFIRELIPELKKMGSVAVIKHLGHHSYDLEDGKDTTGFFESGADISAGINAHKSVVAIRKNSLDAMLALLYDQGIDFVVVEGFKDRRFPKIVIGNLAAESCILRNPTTDRVIASLSSFEEYYKKNV